MNLSPEIWGPHAWFFIDSVIMAYPNNPNNNDKQRINQFLNLLQYMLPCEKCRYNYSQHLSEYPLTDEILSNKDNLLKWVINIHNLSNNNNLNINTVLDYYNNQYSNNKPKTNNNNLYIIVIILSIIIAYYVLKKKN